MRRWMEALALFVASFAFGAAMIWGWFLVSEIVRRF